MAGKRPTPEQRRDIEARVLLAALKASMDRGDLAGAALAHKELSELLKRKQMADTHDDHPQAELAQLGDSNGEAKQSEEQRYELPDDEEAAPTEPLEPATQLTGADASAPVEEFDADQPKQSTPVEQAITDNDSKQAKQLDRSDESAADSHPRLTESSLRAPEDADSAQKAATDAEAEEAADQASQAEPTETSETDEKSEPEVAMAVPAAAKAEESALKDFYLLLQVDQMSSFENIHIKFLRQVRKLLSDRRLNRDTSVWQFRDQLRALCIAHDVLRDPITRTDYDFRLLGLRGENAKQSVELPDEADSGGLGNRSSLRIGELLQCSEILEQQELEIAVDMHKAMPEIPFGQFLVKQEFLTQAELDSALLGQRLILDGKITVGQFQVAMFAVRAESTALGDTIVLRGWANREEVDARTQEDPWPAKLLLAESAIQVTEIPVQQGDADAGYKAPIAASNALPSWAGQLDWGEDDESAVPVLPEGETASNSEADSEDSESERKPANAATANSSSASSQSHKILGTIIDTTDSSDDLRSLAKESQSLVPPITVELNEPSEFPDYYEPTITVEIDEFPPSMDPIRKLLQYDHDEPAETPEAKSILDNADRNQTANLEEADKSDDPKLHFDDDSPSSLLGKTSTNSLEQALALELHRLERESPFQAHGRWPEEPDRNKDESKTEPNLDVGELEPPPLPAEKTKPARSKGDRSKGSNKDDKDYGRSRRSRQTSEVEKRSTDLNDDV